MLAERSQFSPTRAGRPGRRSIWLTLGLGVLAAAAYVALATPNLEAQGLYYDELHQAVGAFTYVGEHPGVGTSYSVAGIPVLNQSYSGAIKTAAFGLYLRGSGRPFRVVEWRLLGIGFVAAGLLAFVILSSARLGPAAIVTFVALFVSDVTVLLATRHDWGPVALALALRLLFVGTWLHAEGCRPASGHRFWLGLIVGLSLFEKLSSVVLMVPLLVILLMSPSRRRPRQWWAALGGLVLGASPLILANLATYLETGRLLSLSMVGAFDSSLSLGDMLFGYFDLSRGIETSRFILGSAGAEAQRTGFLSSVVLLSLAGVLDFVLRRRQPDFLLSGTMLVSYVGVGAALAVVPNGTWVHHWIIGTPFQYLAIALTLEGLWRSVSSRRLLARTAGAALVGVLLLARLPDLVALERSLGRGDSSWRWHPSLTGIGRFAASRSDRASFIVADWGVGLQILCMMGGRSELSREFFWSYPGPGDIEQFLRFSQRDEFYVVMPYPPFFVQRENTRRILADVHDLKGWEEVRPDAEAAHLQAVRVRRFRKRPESSGTRGSP